MLAKGRSLQQVFVETLIQLAEEHEDVVAVTADSSYRITEFKQAFPDRVINVGIAEQTMIGVAAGLATLGMVPYTTCLGFLPAMRACEQVRTDLCYPRLHVVVVAADCGVSLGSVGTTHHATEDLAIMRSFPNMTIISPADSRELEGALRAAYNCEGPVYLRLGPTKVQTPELYGPEYHFELGRAVTLRDGDDVTVAATGALVGNTLDAAQLLAKSGISARVINVHTVKPLDSETILKAARETGAIVTVEEHQTTGGLGGAICECVASIEPVPVLRLGLPDTFVPVGPYDELVQRYGLGAEGIAESVRKFLTRRKHT